MTPKQATRVLIIVRRDMDLDNLAPIAWRLSQWENVTVMILSISLDIDMAHDPRIRYLADRHGIECGLLYASFRPSWRHRLAGWLQTSAQMRRWRSLRHRLLTLLDRANPAGLYDENWCDGLLRFLDPTHIVMDWAKETTGPCGAITRAARKLGIPSFALPHGVDTWDNPEYYVEPLRRAGFFRHFDFIVTPNDIRRNFLASGGFPAERIAVLGSARFCPAWEKVLGDIVAADTHALPAGDRLKVVWFDKQGGRCSPSEVSTLLNRIAALPFVRLAVKNKSNVALGYDAKSLSPEIIDGSAIPSFALCQWGDVLTGLPSGILLDAFVLNKELILPCGFDALGACEPYRKPPVCWIAEDSDAFITALTAIRRGSPERPYLAEDATRFTERMLFPNGSRDDVLDDYADFIMTARPRGTNRSALSYS